MGFLAKRRQLKVSLVSKRIEELTEAIDGIDDGFYPEIVAELRERRRKLAFKRSDLIKKGL
jgi:hypothetical protein